MTQTRYQFLYTELDVVCTIQFLTSTRLVKEPFARGLFLLLVLKGVKVLFYGGY